MAIPTPARVKFLITLASTIRNGAVKTIKQAVAFAEQQFGKIDKSKGGNFSIIQDTFEQINSILSADDSYMSISNPSNDYLYDEKLLRYEIDFLNDKKLNDNQYLNQIGLDTTEKYSIEDIDMYIDEQTNLRKSQISNIINQRKKETYRYKYKKNNFVGGTYRHYNIVDNDTIPSEITIEKITTIYVYVWGYEILLYRKR